MSISNSEMVIQGLKGMANTGFEYACDLTTAVSARMAALWQWASQGLSAGYEASSSFLATNWPIVKDGAVHIGSNYGLHIAGGVVGVAALYGIYKLAQPQSRQV